MKTILLAILILLTSPTKVFSQDATANDVVVRILNFDSNKGKVLVGLYNSEGDFLKNAYKSSISTIENKECTVTFKNVPAGIYAVSLVHDENDNGRMDTNFMGIPKEDYGCSNDAKGFMGPPKWEDAKFEVTNKTIHQTINL
ncbi:MAG: DUF2141 domain-containing protein [Aquaticitalea sp.]